MSDDTKPTKPGAEPDTRTPERTPEPGADPQRQQKGLTPEPLSREEQEERIDEAMEETFPASDPPSYTATTKGSD